MSHGKKVITKLKLKYSEQKEQKQTIVEFASQAVRFWYRANERVKKINANNIENMILLLQDINDGKIEFVRWMMFSPLRWIRAIGIYLSRFTETPSQNLIPAAIETYKKEFQKWQIEAIMGGQVKLSPSQIAVVIGIKEDEVRSMIQELAKEIEEFEKKSNDELAKRNTIQAEARTVNTQKD